MKKYRVVLVSTVEAETETEAIKSALTDFTVNPEHSIKVDVLNKHHRWTTLKYFTKNEVMEKLRS